MKEKRLGNDVWMGIASGRDATRGQKNFHGLYSRCCIDCSVFFERVHFVENETREDYPRCRYKVSSTCYNIHRTISVKRESKEVDSWREIELGKQRDCVPRTLRFRAVSLALGSTVRDAKDEEERISFKECLRWMLVCEIGWHGGSSNSQDRATDGNYSRLLEFN